MNPETVRIQNIIEDFFDHNLCFKPDDWNSDNLKVAKESSRPVNNDINTLDFNIFKNNYKKDDIKSYFRKNMKDSLYSDINIFERKGHHLRRMLRFMDKRYHYIKTVLDIPKEELMLKYTNYLIDAGIKVKRINKKTNSMHVTAVVSLMSIFYDYIYDVFDLTPEYEKDIWDGK